MSFITSSACLHASQMQGYSAPVFSSPMAGPLPPFVVIVVARCSDSEHKQHRVLGGKNTWAKCKHTQAHTQMYADMHTLMLRCKSTEDTSQSLCPSSSHTSLCDSLLPSTLRRKIENQPRLCPVLYTHAFIHATLHIRTSNLCFPFLYV